MKKITKEEKKRYQTASKVLGILMRIANVGCWIGVGGVIAGAIVMAVVAPNVKIDAGNKKIAVFDKTVSYDFKSEDFEYGDDDNHVKFKGSSVVVSDGDKELLSFNLSEDNLKAIEKYIENDLSKDFMVTPIILALVAVLVGVYAVIFGHAANLLKNIAKTDTPFSEENVMHVETAFKFTVIGIILSFAINLLVIATIGFGSNVGVEMSSISVALALYVLSYIFKAGNQLNSEAAKKAN